MAEPTPAPEVSIDSYLSVKPAPLVALVGLQNLHGSLTGRRLLPHPDELSPRYISLEIATTFLEHHPGSGEDQESVILKRDWLHKHTHVIAAVVCLWFDFGAGDTTNGILSTLEHFRSRCRPNCKIVVVLLQGAKEGPLSPGVDERLTTLRKAGHASEKGLFLTGALARRAGCGDGGPGRWAALRSREDRPAPLGRRCGAVGPPRRRAQDRGFCAGGRAGRQEPLRAADGGRGRGAPRGGGRAAPARQEPARPLAHLLQGREPPQQEGAAAARRTAAPRPAPSSETAPPRPA